MLDEVHIRGLGVIEEATLRLGAGLVVLTGETGVGKTMLVSALELLAGARADTSLVRSGSEQALIEARLVPAPPDSGEWAADEGELVASRELPAGGGGSRARIGGRLAPIGALEEVLGPSMEIHGQYEHLRLGRPQVQRRLLDRFAGAPHARELEDYRECYQAWRQASRALARLEEDSRERARELDRLEHEVAEIEAAGPDPDRDEQLDALIGRLEHAEELRAAAAEAAAALGSEGAGDPLGVAVSALRRTRVDDPDLDALRERAVALADGAAELARDVRAYGEGVDVDAARLEELHERRRLIAQLERKYGSGIQAILDYAREASERIAELQDAEAEAGGLEQEVEQLNEQIHQRAAEVRRGRRLAAERLAEEVDEHLADLAMPHARVSIEVEECEPGPEGADEVAFLLAANPGEPAVPLGQGASGGERSRVALAIEVALADANDVEVVVFDEVDAGVGGATAMAVGEKLAQLATSRTTEGERAARQVLCVTHLAQLAAYADQHHVIEKGIADGRTVTTVRQVTDQERAAELARMLGGGVAADAGLAHARELLAEASERRAS